MSENQEGEMMEGDMGVTVAEATRDRMLVAAVGLWKAGGPRAVTMQAVADAAGVSKSLVRTRFGSIEMLVVDIAAELLRGGRRPGGDLEHWTRCEAAAVLERAARSIEAVIPSDMTAPDETKRREWRTTVVVGGGGGGRDAAGSAAVERSLVSRGGPGQ